MSLSGRVVEDNTKQVAITARFRDMRSDREQGFGLLATGDAFRWPSIAKQLGRPAKSLPGEAQATLKANAAPFHVAEMPTMLAIPGKAPLATGESPGSPLSISSSGQGESATNVLTGRESDPVKCDRSWTRVACDTKSTRQLLQEWNFADAYQRKRAGADVVADGETSVSPNWITSARAQRLPFMPPVPSWPTPRRMSLCQPENSQASKPRDSAGPFESNIQTLNERAAGKTRAKEPAGLEDASINGRRNGDGNGHVRWAGKSSRPSGEMQSSLDRFWTSFIGTSSQSAETSSTAETFAYYPPPPFQESRRWGRRVVPEPPAKANTHNKAALCEKVVRNGGTHTAVGQRASARVSRSSGANADVTPFRMLAKPGPITPEPITAREHPQQHCIDAYSHGQGKPCTLPVKTCLDCPIIASGSTSPNDSGPGSISLVNEVQSNKAGGMLAEAKRWRAMGARLWAACTQKVLRGPRA